MSKIKLELCSNFVESFELFQSFNEAKNLATASIENYNNSAKSILAFMDCEDFALADISQNVVSDYIDYCRARGNNNISINTRLRNLRVILNYFAVQGYMHKIPVRLIKADKPIKETYTDAELAVLLKKPNMRTSSFDDYRNWVLINYLIGTGNRIGSVRNIKIKDINLDEQEILLRHTKNKTGQIIPIASVLRSILIEYLQVRKPTNQDDYLFCTWHGEQITYDGVRNAIRRYNRRRGVSKTSIHVFRHTFAKKWIMNGGDILRLQKLLGHKSLDIPKQMFEFNQVVRSY